jgi:hypothetical protein
MVQMSSSLSEVMDPWAECLQGFFRERLAGPGGELGGGHPDDEKEIGFFKDVDEELAALKVLGFLHPLQVDEVALRLKETQPELWFSLEGRREKRWQKNTTDGLMPIHASQA